VQNSWAAYQVSGRIKHQRWLPDLVYNLIIVLCCLQAALLPPQYTLSGEGTQGAAGPHVSLSASLANSGGGVVGGTVAGPLTAACPVLLVLGLFGQG
jgi:hypothetical protein